MSNNDTLKETITNTISLETAQEWSREWNEEESSYNKYNKCNAFLIPVEDLLEVLDEMGILNIPLESILKAKEDRGGKEFIRAYTGVQNKIVNNKLKPEEKLMIVGTKLVNGTYKDMIAGYDDETIGEGGKIFDFSVPCPPACDPESPLNE
ncbi:hypothetical protein [Aquimarina rhabdastrellae]